MPPTPRGHGRHFISGPKWVCALGFMPYLRMFLKVKLFTPPKKKIQKEIKTTFKIAVNEFNPSSDVQNCQIYRFVKLIVQIVASDLIPRSWQTNTLWVNRWAITGSLIQYSIFQLV